MKLDERTLYLGDNGRATCGRLRCAGMTAHFTGRDLSGQRMEPLDARTAIDNNIRCETCGMQPTLVVFAAGGRCHFVHYR